jgi:hypothetical protein
VQAAVKHFTTPRFWELYEQLPEHIQRLADKNYELLKSDPYHPSLHFKKVNEFWSVRVGAHYRALGVDHVVDGEDAVLWFWIGSHSDYDDITS